MNGHVRQRARLRILLYVGPQLLRLANGDGDGGRGREPRDVSLALIPLLLVGHESPPGDPMVPTRPLTATVRGAAVADREQVSAPMAAPGPTSRRR
ncbi:hypothetical protein GCM10017687_76670 [Streptomyces echinatus]